MSHVTVYSDNMHNLRFYRKKKAIKTLHSCNLVPCISVSSVVISIHGDQSVWGEFGGGKGLGADYSE